MWEISPSDKFVVLLLLVCGRRDGMDGVIWGHRASRGVLSTSGKSGDFMAHQKKAGQRVECVEAN